MLLFLCVCAFGVVFAQDQPIVNTTQGVIIGARVNDGDYMAFYGIHYGGSTAGENRFKAPTPPPVYPGEYHAVDSNVICAQPSSRGLIGTEDCLVLNIQTKNLTTPKPVFVWLDGEDYQSSNKRLYSYTHLVNDGLVVVNVNFRLSIFGFLCLRVEEAPGNAGLKDVIQALKWIKQNIAGFGGDPNNIVLAGHGSGAAMVDLVTLSPMSQDLVHKALVLSGSALAPWAVAYDPVEYAGQVAEKLGYGGKSGDELAKLLSATDINVLAGALTDFEFYNNTPLFAPCIEDPKLSPENTFLADAPINILRSGNYSHIPYVAGYTDEEGTIRAEQAAFRGWLEKMQQSFENFLPADLAFVSTSNKTAVSKIIREFYFAQRIVSMETIKDYLDYQGDSLILVPVIKGAKERALTSKAEVRLFEFAYRGTQNSDWAFPQIPLNGARHEHISNYLFRYDLRSVDDTAAQWMTRRIVAFAYTGVPSAVDNPGTTWDAITPSILNMLYISGGETSTNIILYKEEMQADLNKERTTFWDNIYSSYYKPPTFSSANGLLSFGIIVLFTQLLVRFL